jgi:hypothetical protein
MPDSDDIHLPPGKWQALHELCTLYLVAEETLEMNEVSFSYFMRLKNEFFPKLRLPPKQRQTKCKFCTAAAVRRALGLGRDARKAIARQIVKHHNDVRKERAKYWYQNKEIPNEVLELKQDASSQVCEIYD